MLCQAVERRSGTRKVLQKNEHLGRSIPGSSVVHAMGRVGNSDCFLIKLHQFHHLVDSSLWKHTYNFYKRFLKYMIHYAFINDLA